MMTEEQQCLVETHHNIIYYYLHKHSLSIEDNYDVCALALCNAAIKYDKTLGYAFTTYAMKVLDLAIKVEKRNQRRKKRIPSESILSLNTVVADTENLTLNDIISDNSSILDKIDLFDYSSLTPQETQILSLRLQDRTQVEIAHLMNITQGAVSRILKRIWGKLNNEK